MMRMTILRFGWGLVLLALAATATAVPETTAPLSPTTEQRYTTRLATRFLTSYHYQGQELNDELSERIFVQYLRMLDPNRMYFLESDIEQLDRHRLRLDDALRTAEIEPAFEIFALYQRRVEQRIEYAEALLESTTEFDFTVDESYGFDRSEAAWAAENAELDEIWRKRIKNDWLGLKLAEREVDDIRGTLIKRYGMIRKRVSEFNGSDVFQFFMNAFATSIEPHSSYMSPRLAENFEISMKLSLDGIGALLSSDGEYVEIQEVVKGGPADLDGRLKAGDRIIGVAQGDEAVVDVVGWRLDDVVDLIRGERETRVQLEILPAETGLKGPAAMLELVRNEVKLEEQAAKASIEEIETDAGVRRIGVIKVPVFYVDFRGRARNEPNYRSSTRDVRRLINELRSAEIDGLLIDLRGNGGGALVEATTMTGLFIDEGPVVQVRDARGRVTIETDNEPGMAWDGPLAVLVNRSSASASEIFAAAIQDYGRGIILGEPTFGKGTVQNLFNLDNYVTDKDKQLGQLKLTMAKFFRINGGSTQERGVEPDIRLPSYGDPSDYGESSLDYAMPWSSIDSLEFQPLADLSPLLPDATARHLARRESDEIRALIEEFERYDELEARTSVSLLESERRRQQEESEQRRIARFGETPEPAADGDSDGDGQAHGESEDDTDVLRTEAARILADLIELDRSQHRLVQVQTARHEDGLN
ncbi:MAG: tail-specific protease [Gammaproteobacteria bacterium HGW-Gammaproteobacteria-8]|nr:MAG: tail-specific protease [Gammaproteobacteria bacterium HGW-Gammaproteobacteria-8]